MGEAVDSPLLLDTCAMIWAAEDTLPPAAAERLTGAFNQGLPVMISPISAWEFGLLVAKARYLTSVPPLRWMERVLRSPGVQLAPMPFEVLIASSFLPGEPPHDPADRIIAATARENGYTVMTRDRALLAYARAGHLQAVAC
jgi:PIN domain nuclease of toxin-antitoxin system